MQLKALVDAAEGQARGAGDPEPRGGAASPRAVQVRRPRQQGGGQQNGGQGGGRQAAAGGEPGGLGANWIERADGTTDRMTGTDKRTVAAGDVFVIETPGGGGFGDPGTAT